MEKFASKGSSKSEYLVPPLAMRDPNTLLPKVYVGRFELQGGKCLVWSALE